MDAEMVKASFVLPKDLWEWAVGRDQERASSLIRRLLIAERVREEKDAGAPVHAS